MAAGQTQEIQKSAKPNPGVMTSSNDLSQRSFEALLHQRDSLTAEIDGLTSDIYWINDAIARETRYEAHVAPQAQR